MTDWVSGDGSQTSPYYFIIRSSNLSTNDKLVCKEGDYISIAYDSGSASGGGYYLYGLVYDAFNDSGLVLTSESLSDVMYPVYYVSSQKALTVGTFYGNKKDGATKFTYGKITLIVEKGTPSISVNVNGTWKEGEGKVNVNGTWKDIDDMYINDNGTWKQI